ncbi:hypothetical protein HPB48_010977 [Haemaphysalis longicornis]|uniref:Uncharacterized protein n=1 Tax=Haemaphysalis longicornis TaxID=44386 RepID=A0A9J6GQ52_HAELO|nr:hypothetical protein HPB48_010977 [Haemaphysalis longicornis]
MDNITLENTKEAVPRNRWVLLLVALVGLPAVLAALLSYLTSSNGITYCTTLNCQAFAQLLRSSINESVAPCDSFGRFVCDGWRTEHHYSVREQFYRNALESMARLTRAVEIPRAGQSAVQQVAAFYRSCDKLYETGRDDTPLVREALAEAGVLWPSRPANPDVVHTLAALALRLGWASILDIDIKTIGRKRTIVSFTTAPMFYFLHSENLRPLERLEHFNRLRDAFDNGGSGPKVSYGDIEVLENATLTNLTRASFMQGHAHLGPAVLHRNPAEWNASIARFLRTGKEVQFETTSPAYVEAFADFWRAQGEGDAHLLVSWHAVRFAAHFARVDLVNPSAVKRADETYGRRHICIMTLYMALGDVVFASYNAYAFTDSVRGDVKKVVLGVREALSKKMRGESAEAAGLDGWSSVERVFSVLDYSRTNPGIEQTPLPGLSDFGDVFVDNWLAALRAFELAERTPKRFLSPGTLLHSRIFEITPEVTDIALVPMALAYPFYDKAATAAVKYGGLGSHVSRASARIVLARFKNDSDDKAPHSRQLSLAAFLACIAADVAGQAEPPRHDVAEELAALLVLFDAFSAAEREDQRRLAEFPEFSSRQIFFSTWCFMRCTGQLSEPDDVDPCSAEVRHVQAFSEAFRCVKGTQLNPERKCRLS